MVRTIFQTPSQTVLVLGLLAHRTQRIQDYSQLLKTLYNLFTYLLNYLLNSW